MSIYRFFLVASAVSSVFFDNPAYASPALPSELLVNGEFESGDLSGWSFILAANASNVSVSPNNPFTGSYALKAGPLGTLEGPFGNLVDIGGIQQTVIIPPNSPFLTLSLSFKQNSDFVPAPGPYIPNSFISLVLADINNVSGYNRLGPEQNPLNGPYRTLTTISSLDIFPDVATNGGPLSVSLRFGNLSGYFDIDDVSMKVCETGCGGIGVVPLPRSLSLFASALATIGLLVGRRKRKAKIPVDAEAAGLAPG